MSRDKFKGNLFELAHCMLCMKKENIQVLGHHRDDFLIGFFFVCPKCLEIVKDSDVYWEIVRERR